MISVILSWLAGAATPPPPPLVSMASPPVVYRAMPHNAPLPPLADFVVPEVRARASLPRLFSTSDYPAAALRADGAGNGGDRRCGRSDRAGNRVRRHDELGINDPRCHDLLEARLVSTAMAKRFAVANREVVLEQGLLVGGPDRAREIGRSIGETFGEMLVLAVEFDAGGAVVDCAGAYGDENAQRVAQTCADTMKRKVLPTDKPAANATRRGALLRVLHPPNSMTLPRAS